MELPEARNIYHAFISYSQEADKLLAPEVQNALHRVAQPWHRLHKSRLRIFRDVTNMGKHNDLTEAIKDGIRNADNFILMASKKAKASPWVNKEVAYFKECQSSEQRADVAKKIAIVVTDGDIRWDTGINDWDWEVTNVLPDDMKHVFESEPLWIDMRQVKKENTVDIKGSIFNAGVIKLAAFILKKDPDEIDSQEIRKRRLWLRVTATVIITLAVSLAATVYQTKKARENEDSAKLAAIKADSSAQVALAEKQRANIQADTAEARATYANKQKKIADDRTKDALHQREVAEAQRAFAETQRARAESATMEATEARDVATKALREESAARERESIERKKTSLMNRLLVAENLALTSIREESLTKALAAYDSFNLIDKTSLRHYFNSDDRWYDKYPIIYDALKVFYEATGPRIKHSSEAWTVGNLNDGRVLATSLDGNILIYDYARRESITVNLAIEFPRTITNIFLLPSKECLLVALDNRDLLLYKVFDRDIIRQWVLKQPASEFISVKEHNNRLLFLTEDGTLYLSELVTSTMPSLRKLYVDNVKAIWADMITDDSIVLYDGQYFRFFSQTELLPRRIPQKGVTAIFLDKKNAKLYCGVSKVDPNRRVRSNIVTITAGADRAEDLFPQVIPWTGNSRIEHLAVSYSGTKIVSIEANKQLRIFDVGDRPLLLKSYTLGSKPRSIAINATDELFVAMENGTVESWPLHISELYARLMLLPSSKATIAQEK